MRSLAKDQKVTYDLEQDNRGKTKAVNLQGA
jgi:CspA family cold shock protein